MREYSIDLRSELRQMTARRFTSLLWGLSADSRFFLVLRAKYKADSGGKKEDRLITDPDEAAAEIAAAGW